MRALTCLEKINRLPYGTVSEATLDRDAQRVLGEYWRSKRRLHAERSCDKHFKLLALAAGFSKQCEHLLLRNLAPTAPDQLCRQRLDGHLGRLPDLIGQRHWAAIDAELQAIEPMAARQGTPVYAIRRAVQARAARDLSTFYQAVADAFPAASARQDLTSLLAALAEQTLQEDMPHDAPWLESLIPALRCPANSPLWAKLLDAGVRERQPGCVTIPVLKDRAFMVD